MASRTTTIECSTVLGKRKSSQGSYVLHLASSPEPSHASQSDNEWPRAEQSTTASQKPAITNGQLRKGSGKPYKCSFSDCDKAYAKPSRLEEHERSHTGIRPFVCSTCNKSYFRESHLQAHARSHLPASSRPLGCPESNCDKRFWTSQHLRVHIDWHNGAKPFACTETDCHEAFAKHNQLRSHISLAHSPPGTRPFQCTQEGCTKSFDTNQHLKTHLKTHDEKRYTCVQMACLPKDGESPTYYSTWTALQHHIRTAHPPTCPHSTCNGKTFSNRGNLRAHVKLHEEQEIEANLIAMASDSDAEDEAPPRKKRRGGDIGRDWKCSYPGCTKDFKSKKALQTHNSISHLGQRNFVCPVEDCKQAFSYKNLLQRHTAKIHAPSSTSDGSPSDEEETGPQNSFDIGDITGTTYATRAKDRLESGRSLQCPYPTMDGLCKQAAATVAGPSQCDYVFSRAYDLRRHLKATHGMQVEKKDAED